MNRRLLYAVLALGLASLACSGLTVSNDSGNPVHPLAGVAYWAAETATPVPTETRFVGTTTPVIPPTPTPYATGLPGPTAWVTVTATSIPSWATATPTLPPPAPTATWQWVTTTPIGVTTTPVPPATTTPALDIFAFTTPVPTETPYYRVGSFYMNADVYIGGPGGVILRLTGHTTTPGAAGCSCDYHVFELDVTNQSGSATLIPLSDVFFIREREQGGEVLTGRWLPSRDPLTAIGLPPSSVTELTPVPDGATRTVHVGIALPAGSAPLQLGLVTDWARPVEGGLPVWFLLMDDPAGPFVDAVNPPPPTPVVYDDWAAYNWQGVITGTLPITAPIGTGLWPTNGTVTRGFSCQPFFTGVDGTGWGCPATEPWFHTGVDIANMAGNGIVSPIAGTMTFAGPDTVGADCAGMAGSDAPHTGFGNYSTISGGGMTHYLAHLSSWVVTSGAVTPGQLVAGMGSTGCSTGSHLHWQILQGGTLIDPAAWAGPGPPP